jgi:isovaleryl-CoA dehydrogenase
MDSYTWCSIFCLKHSPIPSPRRAAPGAATSSTRERRSGRCWCGFSPAGRAIAEGRHITTLALSEPGTGANFFLPRTRFLADGDHFRLNGRKSFVTNGGHADSYVVSAVHPGAEFDPGTFTCLVMDANAPGLNWCELWQGIGMRGNSSRGVQLDQVRVPAANLLGVEGDQIWYVLVCL